MEKRELSYTVGGNVNYAVTMESDIEVTQKKKKKKLNEKESCHMTQQSHSWAYVQKR